MGLFGTNTPDPSEKPLPEEEDRVLEKLAKKVVEWRMAVPAIMFLESVKPLNFIGSQAMVFFEPIVQTVFNFRDYDTLRTALERRQTIEILLLKIEAYDDEAMAREKRVKRYLKEQKKQWSWVQRWIGIGRPRVQIPEDVINPPAEDQPEDDNSNSRS